jgi:hypothetical protein
MGRAFEAISIADLVEQRKSSVRPEFCDQYERARGRQRPVAGEKGAYHGESAPSIMPDRGA